MPLSLEHSNILTSGSGYSKIKALKSAKYQNKEALEASHLFLFLYILSALQTQHAPFTDTENHKANIFLSERDVINAFTHLPLLAVKFPEQGDKNS